VGAIVATDLPTSLAALPFLVAVVVGVGRIYVGAHNPLDVTAGLGLGVLVGAVLTLPLG
jgi:membrane-associated phospholipid phosphatase